MMVLELTFGSDLLLLFRSLLGRYQRCSRINNFKLIVGEEEARVHYIDIKERILLKIPGYENPMEFSVLTSFTYPLEGGLGELVVSTTRVETMLGDTKIDIHPKDEITLIFMENLQFILLMEENYQ